MAPIAVVRRVRGQDTGLDMPLIGFLLGGGIVCYANSFLLTDVVRALLMFYLVPVWGTLIEWLVLRRRVAAVRALTLALGLGGAWIVIGADGGWPLPRNAGDWLGLAGGLLVAMGSARVNVVQPPGVFPSMFAFFLYGGMVAATMSVALSGEFGPPPTSDAVVRLLPWLVLIAVGFFIPTNGILLWGAARVAPGLFGLLMLAEIVLGVASAALWAGEPFGWREAVGSVMILAAGATEALISARRPPPG